MTSTTSKEFNKEHLEVKFTKNKNFMTVLYKNNTLYISSGKCKVPFGVDQYKNNYTMKLENTPFRYIQKIEKCIEEKVNEYLTKNTSSEIYTINSQIITKKRFKPDLIVKLPQVHGKFCMDIINKRKEYKTYSDILPNSFIQTFLYIRSLWLKNNKIYYRWNCSTIMIDTM